MAILNKVIIFFFLNSRLNSHYHSFSANSLNHNTELIKGVRLIINQWIAMFKKKYLYSVRNWILYLLQNIIPIAFIIISVLVSKSMREQTGLPPLRINLGTYDQSVTVVDKSVTPESNSTMARYEQLINSNC